MLVQRSWYQPDPSEPVAGRSLLELREELLLRVMQYCAGAKHHHLNSLFSAARAHPMLHQAAVQAVRSIRADMHTQKKLDGMLRYLEVHGQHVGSIELWSRYPRSSCLRQFPPSVKLRSLQLARVQVQLQPGGGFQGVLGAAAALTALTQLQLTSCDLLDDAAAEPLAAALSQLPAGMQNLKITIRQHRRDEQLQFPTAVLQQQLQHLTYLELAGVDLQGPNEETPALQPLQALTRLVDLRLSLAQDGGVDVTASMLSDTHNLTRLDLFGSIEPSVLADKALLLHARLGKTAGGAAAEAQLLSQLQPLQQLTHLSLWGSLQAVEEGNPPAAAYSALTASSKLQRFSFHNCTLPTGVWQHVFPAGRQLQHLTWLRIAGVKQPSGEYASAPEGSLLASCCAGLQVLDMTNLQYSAEQLSSLQGLTSLHTLHLVATEPLLEMVQALRQLAGLRALQLDASSTAQGGLLLQLTAVQQLTRLKYEGPVTNGGDCKDISIRLRGRGDEPVWRQILRRHLYCSDPALVQQAAAALAE